MCAKAIVDARIDPLYFGANEPKTGAIESIDQFLDRDDLNHQVFLVEDICKSNLLSFLRKFFQSKREKKLLKKIYFNSSQIGQ